MTRPLFTFIAALSLMLCIVAAALCIRSFWVAEIWEFSRMTRPQTPTAGEDEYIYLRIQMYRGYYDMTASHYMAMHGRNLPHVFHVASRGGGLGYGDHGPFSLGKLALLFALPPASWITYRKQRGVGLGRRCRACGYNLTGNVSGVCPECGTPVPRNVEPKP